MRERKWLVALAAVMATGLIAAGCGSDDNTTTVTAGDATVTTETTDGETSTTVEADSTGATPEDVYNACIDVIEGTAAESAGQTACEQARTAFEQCTSQAESTPEGSARELAIKACQTAADQATAALLAGG
jgi:hypothetical protein